MSRILRCECGFYTSFGHSSRFPWIWMSEKPAEEKIEMCEKGEADPFSVYHSACPSCGERFRPWAQEELFLPWDEFVQKMLGDANIFVVSQFKEKCE